MRFLRTGNKANCNFYDSDLCDRGKLLMQCALKSVKCFERFLIFALQTE